MCRVGQNHLYTVCIYGFWQGNDQIYRHIRCIYTVLAYPTYVRVDERQKEFLSIKWSDTQALSEGAELHWGL
jgi:hypothetical protein